jgi:Arc/MetJ-type ribon-helix-helix transcriptional regulator
MVRIFQTLQDMGLYPSRSEAIRAAMREFFITELRIPPSQRKSKMEESAILTTSQEKDLIAVLLKKLREEDD